VRQQCLLGLIRRILGRRTSVGTSAEKLESGMMKDVLPFDGNLAMFCEAPKGINVAYLRFLRWLVEQGRLEHLPAGPPAGEWVRSE
jgi:hypothetical protein